jgi:hypothetical protein
MIRMPILATVVWTISIFLPGDASATYAAQPTDACALLTTAQVSAALDATVGQGTYTPGTSIPAQNKLDCYWWQTGHSWIEAKRVQLEILDPADDPLGTFNQQWLVGTKTTVSGVGDAAYYLVYANRIDLYVKKGGQCSLSSLAISRSAKLNRLRRWRGRRRKRSSPNCDLDR